AQGATCARPLALRGALAVCLAVLEAGEAAGLRVVGGRAIDLRAAGAIGERLGAHAEAAGHGGGAEAVVGRDPAAAADRVAAHGRAGQGAACARAPWLGGDGA